MTKQVKVDNWGIYFLQRLKHFFNRTDYCDLTLQFMDNAQLKVHRLVLNACTEYFDVLERTCEMYEDYLIMPDDLQADVVVPIVNFMYTGQLEYKPEMLDKLIQTAQIMNIPVLAKLLDAQRQQKTYKPKANVITPTVPTPVTLEQINQLPKQLKRPAQRFAPGPSPPSKKPYVPIIKKPVVESSDPNVFVKVRPKSVMGPHGSFIPMIPKQRYRPPAPRPTRCELPEDLEENLLTDSFSTISYDSKPLIVHPETTKRYSAVKQHSLYTDVLSSRKSSTIDIIHNKNKKPLENLFEDLNDYYEDDVQMIPDKTENKLNLFDEVKNSNPKVTIEGDDNQQGSSIDHAKIISEVLKKYPYLVKGNKSIKLKILDTKPPPKPKAKIPRRSSKSPKISKVKLEPAPVDTKPSYPDDMLDSKKAAHLISLGAENVSGPWICMICGTPGKALSFSTYYAFRRHLVEVHHEKVISNRCEHCGYKTNKLSYLLHHLYTKHNVPPPQHCNFPKCNECGFIAQNPAHLVKHKMMHSTKKKKCGACFFEFSTTANLMRHIKVTGHSLGLNYSNRQNDVQCVYCAKPFVREQNLFIHYKSHHPTEAKRDGIVEDSDEEHVEDAEDSEESEAVVKQVPIRAVPDPLAIKREPNLYNTTYDSEDSVDALGTNPQLVEERKQAPAPVTQRLLNASFEVEIANQPEQDVNTDEFNANITVRDANTNEFILPNSEFTQNKPEEVEYFITDQNEENVETAVEQECVEETENTTIPDDQQPVNESTPQVQIVVSNAEEYKALMASNHPIIFDADGNPTKTLAVLTTPQAVPMTSTPMQVETGNTNNIMIMPEDYGCVSQTPGDGNIVVVYSQQLVGDNKQFIVDNSYTQPQIVSAADMNAHFIQTSAGLTPSYTSAACSTMVQGQVVMPQTIVSWDGNVTQEIVTQQSHDQEHIEILQEQEHIPEEIANAEEEVDAQPGVQYGIQDQNDGTPSMEGDTDTQSTLENIQLIETEMAENDSVTTDDIQIIQESCSPVEEINKLSEDVIEAQESMEISNVELPNNEVEIDEEIANDEANETETTEVAEVHISTNEVMTNGSNNDEYMPLNNLIDHAPKENIQNLTSEWSDDEVETGTNDLDENADTEELPAVSMETEDRTSIEESIENIQEEVNKQTNENIVEHTNENIEEQTDENYINQEVTNTEDLQENINDQDADQDTNENDNEDISENDISQEITENDINQEISENDVQESEQTENVVLESEPNNLMKTQHKITSLLNDWVENDNDSQEEDEAVGNQDSSVEDGAMEEGTVMEIVKQSESESAGPVTANPDINNLVNDWEEEEETTE